MRSSLPRLTGAIALLVFTVTGAARLLRPAADTGLKHLTSGGEEQVRGRQESSPGGRQRNWILTVLNNAQLQQRFLAVFKQFYPNCETMN